jgi:hypothetical protein
VTGWPEVVQWTISTLAPAASGLCGVGLGAWMVTRRERANMKREAYAALVAGFQQTQMVYRRLESSFKVSLPSSDPGAVGKELFDKFEPELKEARTKLYGAMAVGRIVLSKGTRVVLAAYLTNDAEAVAAKGEGVFELFRARRQAIEEAQERIEREARAELGFDD